MDLVLNIDIIYININIDTRYINKFIASKYEIYN